MWSVRQWTPCVSSVELWLWSFQLFHDLCGSRFIFAQEFFLTESLRHISNVSYVGWTFLWRMIREWYPGECCTEGPEKKISQSLIGTSGVVRCWTADIFSKSNIHFLEVVSIKSTYLWIQAHHRMSALGNVLPEVYSVQDLTPATYAISRVDSKRYLKFKSIKLWDKFFTGLRKAIGDQTNLTRLTMSITL